MHYAIKESRHGATCCMLVEVGDEGGGRVWRWEVRKVGDEGGGNEGGGDEGGGDEGGGR